MEPIVVVAFFVGFFLPRAIHWPGIWIYVVLAFIMLASFLRYTVLPELKRKLEARPTKTRIPWVDWVDKAIHSCLFLITGIFLSISLLRWGF